MKIHILLPCVVLIAIPLLAQENADPAKPIAATAEQRTSYTAGDKQELLSPAAAYAIEAQDIALLESLRSAGWNASLPLGRMPDARYDLKMTPLTLAVSSEAVRSLAWLVTTCKVSLEARDDYGERGIDWATEGNRLGEEEGAINLDIVNLLKREAQPGESDVLAELANTICHKSTERMNLHTVNGRKPGALWKEFDELLVTAQGEAKRRTTPVQSEQGKTKPKSSQSDQDSPEAMAKPVSNLIVRWTRIDKSTYEFSFRTSDEAMSGGGMSGRIYFKYGYWLTKIEKTWDS